VSGRNVACIYLIKAICQKRSIDEIYFCYLFAGNGKFTPLFNFSIRFYMENINIFNFQLFARTSDTFLTGIN